MDFSNRGPQPQPISRPNQTGNVGGHNNHNSNNDQPRKKSGHEDTWVRIAVLTAVAAVVVLLISLIVLSLVNKDNNYATADESAYIIEKDMQAVFLNTGQVYFGDISSMNDRYLVLNNIYYLQAENNDATANNANNVSLIKLGCELHKPNDQMIFNRDQVTFWENLGDNGQVAKAVEQYKQKFPEGNKNCVDQSKSSSSNSSESGGAVQSTENPTGSAPATGSTTNP